MFGSVLCSVCIVWTREMWFYFSCYSNEWYDLSLIQIRYHLSVLRRRSPSRARRKSDYLARIAKCRSMSALTDVICRKRALLPTAIFSVGSWELSWRRTSTSCWRRSHLQGIGLFPTGRRARLQTDHLDRGQSRGQVRAQGSIQTHFAYRTCMLPKS